MSTNGGFTYPTKKSSASLSFFSVLSHTLSFHDELSQLRWDWPRPFCGGQTFVLNIQPGVATLTQTLHCFLFGHCALISPSNHRGGALFIQWFIVNLCHIRLILLLWISYLYCNHSCRLCNMLANIQLVIQFVQFLKSQEIKQDHFLKCFICISLVSHRYMIYPQRKSKTTYSLNPSFERTWEYCAKNRNFHLKMVCASKSKWKSKENEKSVGGWRSLQLYNL